MGPGNGKDRADRNGLVNPADHLAQVKSKKEVAKKLAEVGGQTK